MTTSDGLLAATIREESGRLEELLKKTAEAQKHFQTLHDSVTTDISKSRAAYWLGRTHETAGRAKEANDWYSRASKFGQTFYGQLASRKLPDTAARLPTDPVATDSDRQTLGGRDGALSRPGW